MCAVFLSKTVKELVDFFQLLSKPGNQTAQEKAKGHSASHHIPKVFMV